MLLLLLLVSICIGQWTQVKQSAPTQYTVTKSAQPSPMFTPITFCEGTSLMYNLGGSEMWIYEQDEQRWLWQPNLPTDFKPRNQAAYWYMGGELYLFGGITDTQMIMGDLWIYKTKTRVFEPIIVEGRVKPGNCYGTTYWTHYPSNRMYLWGGTCDNNENTTQLFAYDLTENQWHNVMTEGNGPKNGKNGAAVVSRSETEVFIYVNDQLWMLDLTTFEWSNQGNANTPPGPNRRYMKLWQSTTDDSILLYGGIAGGKIFGDTWNYHPVTNMWTAQSNKGPAPRYAFGTCVNSNGYLYLFGGTNQEENGETQAVFNDVWQYGPFNVKNVIDQIQWKLDSSTLFSTIAASFSGITMLILCLIILVNCLKKCINRKRKTNILNSNQKVYYVNDNIEFENIDSPINDDF